MILVSTIYIYIYIYKSIHDRKFSFNSYDLNIIVTSMSLLMNKIITYIIDKHYAHKHSTTNQ